jgi:hypothetical protein
VIATNLHVPGPESCTHATPGCIPAGCCHGRD